MQALAERELVRHQIGFASRTEGTNIQGGRPSGLKYDCFTDTDKVHSVRLLTIMYLKVRYNF